mmetsp:Transcript_44060/g.106225  ORF Transcript_44060/g.106225 Transcript_44060/m.106225 type:complete len:205 (-) Transcript_44060:1697-2311(-)
MILHLRQESHQNCSELPLQLHFMKSMELREHHLLQGCFTLPHTLVTEVCLELHFQHLSGVRSAMDLKHLSGVPLVYNLLDSTMEHLQDCPLRSRLELPPHLIAPTKLKHPLGLELVLELKHPLRRVLSLDCPLPARLELPPHLIAPTKLKHPLVLELVLELQHPLVVELLDLPLPLHLLDSLVRASFSQTDLHEVSAPHQNLSE